MVGTTPRCTCTWKDVRHEKLRGQDDKKEETARIETKEKEEAHLGDLRRPGRKGEALLSDEEKVSVLLKEESKAVFLLIRIIHFSVSALCLEIEGESCLSQISSLHAKNSRARCTQPRCAVLVLRKMSVSQRRSFSFLVMYPLSG